ncbi:MAG: hypothetical protein NVS1B7_7570 [Candidatus Saccharimonadales bacterium]
MRTFNFTTSIKQMPRKVVAATAALLILAVPMTALAAWGPDRPTYDYTKANTNCNVSVNLYDRCGSMTGPVFNSFINTPSYGDERNFVTASKGSTADWHPGVTVAANDEIQVRVYVHNNANQDFNDAAHNYLSVAHNTRVRFYLPTGAGTNFDIGGYVSADNATPGRVYSTANVSNSSQAFSLSYVPGSAMIYNNGPFKSGHVLSDDVVSETGTQIGYEQLNGDLPGCFDYASVVTIKVKVSAPALQFTKQVTTPGSTNWQPTITASKGDTVSWLLHFTNTGTGKMDDLTLRDQLPAGVTIVPGTITWIDSNHPNGSPLSDTSLDNGGIDLGTYGPQGGGAVRFRTVISKDFQGCTLENVAYAKAQTIGEVASRATVQIANCTTPKPPVPPAAHVTPTVLPNTGNGAPEVAGIFAAVTAVGALAHRYLLSRRYDN